VRFQVFTALKMQVVVFWVVVGFGRISKRILSVRPSFNVLNQISHPYKITGKEASFEAFTALMFQVEVF
jgi:hypothetical protein